MRSSSSPRVSRSHLQLERVRVIRAGSEVRVDSCAATERSSVRRLFVVAVLRLHALPVTGRGVGGAHRLATWTAETKPWNDWQFSMKSGLSSAVGASLAANTSRS